MSLSVVVEIPRRPLARITGGFYLAFVLALAIADALANIGVGDVERAYEVLSTDQSQFAVGLTFALLSAFLFVMAAWGLYVLLRPINRELALLFLLLNAIGVAVQVASYVPVIFAMEAADASGFALAFSDPQLESLQRLAFDVQKFGFVTAQLFFATWLFPLGYLVYRSGFLPRFLGVLLILDGFAIALWFFQGMVLPDNTALSTPGLALSFVAEVGLGLWLLFKGIKAVPDGSGASNERSSDSNAP